MRTREEKHNINRAIVILVLGLIIALFLVFNSPERFNAGILYSIMGIATIGAYMIWDRF